MLLAVELMLALAKCDERLLGYIVSEGTRPQHAAGEAIHNALVSMKNTFYFFSILYHLSLRAWVGEAHRG